MFRFCSRPDRNIGETGDSEKLVRKSLGQVLRALRFGTFLLSRLRERGTARSVVERGATGKRMRAPDFIRERAKSLRRTMTRPKRTLWSMLRRDQLNLHFRRQHPIGPFILDFYCAREKLCVEIDGPAHAESAEYDQRRTAWLEKEGIRVLRFTADDVERRPAFVVRAIMQAAAPSTAFGGSPPP